MGFNPVAWISWPPSIVLGCTVRLLLFAGMPRFVHDATLSPSECISLINSLRVAGRKEYLAEPTLGCVPLLICAPRIPFPDKANRIERHARLDTLPPPPPSARGIQLCEFLRRFAYESSAFRFAWLDVYWWYYCTYRRAYHWDISIDEPRFIRGELEGNFRGWDRIYWKFEWNDLLSFLFFK